MLTFNSVEHRYSYDGVPVPGVTSVLQAAGLLDFGGASPEAMAFAGARGTAAHTACELDDKNDLVEESVQDEILGYLTAWRKFRAETGFVPETIEERVYHERYKYAGTLDRIGVFQGVESLIDLKTGTPQRATGVQLAGYAMAVDLKSGHRLPRYAIHLQQDGNYKLIRYTNPSDFAVFIAALTLYNWKATQ